MFVSNVLELVDVDNSTGDIDYNGDVSIKGKCTCQALLLRHRAM